MKIYFISFGCKVNQYETECLKQLFEEKGYKIVENKEKADIFLINSCTVTSSTDNKVLQCIKRLRRDYPKSVIVFSGCYPQAFPEKASEIIEADVITGTKKRINIIKLIDDYLIKNSKMININQFQSDEKYDVITRLSSTGKTRAFVKIQDGCNQFCSYCIIPYARGRIRSKPLEEIRKEVQLLAQNGHKEIVLVGINLAFYGAELGLKLADAVEECNKINEIKRIRLGSLEPEMLTDEDLSRFFAAKKFCPHFHLSLQSGCDKTLKAMNRKYTTSEYAELVERIKNIFNDCSFTTDVMVGFPGETEDDFYKSMEFVKSIGFSKVHVFPYSKREGTLAAKFPNQIPENIKIERAKIMTELCDKSANEFLKSRIGKILPVLFEKENSCDFHRGHAPDYTFVKVPSKKYEKSLRNMIFYVKIIGYEYGCCIGEIIN